MTEWYRTDVREVETKNVGWKEKILGEERRKLREELMNAVHQESNHVLINLSACKWSLIVLVKARKVWKETELRIGQQCCLAVKAFRMCHS